jgi:hypothetical protein
LREARTQADIAQQSINTTVEQFRLDQRAWLFPSQPEQPILHAPGQVTGGIFVIRNSGKTVAKQVQVRNVMLRVVHTNASKNWIDLKLHEGLIGSADFKVIFPSQDTPKFATVLTSGYGSLSHEQIENLHRGESFLALSGTLKYSDVYNVQHRTRFCFYWLYLLNPAPSIDIHRNQSETVPSAVMACTQYNDVDTNSRTERKRSSPAR